MTKIISVGGPDGSGKSSVVAEIQDALERGGTRTIRVWLRMFHLTSLPVLAIARLTGITERVQSEDGETFSVHRFERSRLLGWAYEWCKLFDYAIAWSWVLLRARGRTILLDRFVYDVIVDLMTSTKRADISTSRVGRALLAIVPRNHSGFLLAADAETLCSRRPTNRRDPHFLVRLGYYQEMSRSLGIPLIDSSNTKPAEIARMILQSKAREEK